MKAAYTPRARRGPLPRRAHAPVREAGEQTTAPFTSSSRAVSSALPRDEAERIDPAILSASCRCQTEAGKFSSARGVFGASRT